MHNWNINTFKTNYLSAKKLEKCQNQFTFPRLTLPAISITTFGTVVRRRRVDNTWPVAALTARSEARYRLRTAISAYHTCIPRPCYGDSCWNIAMPFGKKKTRMAWLPDGEKNLKMFIRFDRFTNVTDRQTDGQTPHDDIGHACTASLTHSLLRLTS